jgi:hypothetical protein
MHKLLLLFVTFSPLLSLSQEKNEELVYWSPGQRLTWNDYKGKADPSTGAAASTATYLGIDYNFSPAGLSYKITCSFSKTRSWGLHKNEHILNHEQGHFDIAEIFARKLNMQMTAYKFNRNTYQQDLKKIYQDIVNEKEEMQNTYDEETDHSIKKDKQEEWLVKIGKMLNEYNKYARY